MTLFIQIHSQFCSLRRRVFSGCRVKPSYFIKWDEGAKSNIACKDKTTLTTVDKVVRPSEERRGKSFLTTTLSRWAHPLLFLGIMTKSDILDTGLF